MEHKTFVIHIAILSVNLGDEVHLSKKIQIAHLKTDEASFKMPSKYADFADVFSPKLAIELPKYIGINNHIIELIDE